MKQHVWYKSIADFLEWVYREGGLVYFNVDGVYIFNMKKLKIEIEESPVLKSLVLPTHGVKL